MISEYSALLARMKAVKSNLLSRDTFLKLIEVNTNDEVAKILLTTAYEPYIKKHSKGEHYRREYIERALRDSFMDMYFKALVFLPKAAAKIVKEALRRFELENIKLILRSRGKEDEFGLVKEDLIDLRSYSKIPFEELLNLNTIEEVAEHLKDTPYGNTLRRITESYKEEGLFAIEMGLDYEFFRRLIYLAKSLSFPDRDIMRFYLGLECDMLNLLWILRAKLIHKFSDEVVFTYTLPFGHLIKDAMLRRIVKINSIAEIQATLEGNPWEDVFEGIEYFSISTEIKMKRKFYNTVINSQLLKANPFSIAPFIETLTLKEVEVTDITTIIESKRYQFTTEEMQKYLITEIPLEVNIS